jgi:intracellular sulfur oxidation DsrE/DsrF family protein
MNCTDAARLLNAHCDGELELASSLAVEEHLEGCAACRRSYANLRSVRDAIARHAAAPPAPESLRRQIEEGIRPPVAGKLAAWLRSPLALAAPGVVALALAGWTFFAGSARPGAAPLRVVYHISESENAGAALRNLANHLQAAPEARVVVVAHNNGVDFLLAGARDESGLPFELTVREYRRKGVEFRVCRNTLVRRGIADSSVIPEANLVPSGIAEIGRLQTREGYAYMRL